jgi:recombination protein RecR
MNLPRPLQELSDQFAALPGIGKKTASRLAFYLLNVPSERLTRFSQALLNLKQKVHKCKICFNLTEDEVCEICADQNRDQQTLCVVEEVLDLIVMEQTKKYHGLYHVLYGRIDPLNNLGPDDILIPQLLERINKIGKNLKEIIISTNPNMEGETTAMYIRNKLRELQGLKNYEFKITRLAYGLPMGASIEYADYTTLGRSLENRSQF